jgi:hypothetical protein
MKNAHALVLAIVLACSFSMTASADNPAGNKSQHATTTGNQKTTTGGTKPKGPQLTKSVGSPSPQILNGVATREKFNTATLTIPPK